MMTSSCVPLVAIWTLLLSFSSPSVLPSQPENLSQNLSDSFNCFDRDPYLYPRALTSKECYGVTEEFETEVKDEYLHLISWPPSKSGELELPWTRSKENCQFNLTLAPPTIDYRISKTLITHWAWALIQDCVATRCKDGGRVKLDDDNSVWLEIGHIGPIGNSQETVQPSVAPQIAVSWRRSE